MIWDYTHLSNPRPAVLETPERPEDVAEDRPAPPEQSRPWWNCGPKLGWQINADLKLKMIGVQCFFSLFSVGLSMFKLYHQPETVALNLCYSCNVGVHVA
jgi:hypothetical protein